MGDEPHAHLVRTATEGAGALLGREGGAVPDLPRVLAHTSRRVEGEQEAVGGHARDRRLRALLMRGEYGLGLANRVIERLTRRRRGRRRIVPRWSVVRVISRPRRGVPVVDDPIAAAPVVVATVSSHDRSSFRPVSERSRAFDPGIRDAVARSRNPGAVGRGLRA